MYPKKKDKVEKEEVKGVNLTRLNKFLSNASVANRRQADVLIKNGLISVNGIVVKEVGTKISWRDKVYYEGKRVYPGEKIYVLVNKPKGFVGTNKLVEGKRSMADLVNHGSPAKLYAVDYLAMNAKGLLLLTNNGDFAENFGQGDKPVEQLFKVELNKPLAEDDMKTLSKGVKIDNKLVVANSIAYVDETKKIIGIELRSSIKNVVMKAFSSLGYPIINLDRVIFAGLTKKNLARGQWRFLTEREVIKLKHSI